MDVITMDSAAWKELNDKIDNIETYIHKAVKNSLPLAEMYVESADVARYLCISKRTLQRLRSNGSINYSKIGGVCYYSLAEIKRMMQTRMIRRPEEKLNDLINFYQTRVAKK